MMKTAIVLYEPHQLASLDTLVSECTEEGEMPGILSLDTEINYALEKRGMSFISGGTLQNRTAPATYMRADELTRTLCESKTLSFLEYRGVSLLKPLRFTIHLYFLALLYYVEIFATFLDRTKDVERLVVLAPTTPVFATSAFLAEHGVFAIVEAARRVSESRGIAFEMVQNTPATRAGNKLQKAIFAAQRWLFGIGISILNVAISLRPQRNIRVIASDYWRNIAPIMRELPEAELFLLDRREAFKAGIKNVWRHKIRFVHVKLFLSRHEKREALRHAEAHLEQWRSVRSRAWDGADLTFCGVSLALVCERIMTRLMERAVPRVVCEIAATYAMYECLSPNAVLLRASVSEQIHFTILPLVAKQSNIPSLESQHGIQYFGPGSPTTHHAAEYIATYGNLVNKEFMSTGYESLRLLSVGSPRFDSYSEAENVPHQKDEDITFLSVAPAIGAGEGFGTFSIGEYFAALGYAIKKIPKAHLIISARHGSYRRTLAKEAETRGLAGISYESVAGVPLPRLFAQADIIICSYSTVVYEAMLHRKPVVVVAFAPIERLMSDFHFSKFAQEGALAIAHSPEELSFILQKLAKNAEEREHTGIMAKEFMSNNFSFDGHASKKTAQIVRAWAHEQHTLHAID